MRGKVISRQKCPECGQKGGFVGPQLICPCGRWAATRPEIEIYWKRKRIRISHDQQGRRFATAEHAERALGLIRNQIETGSFYPDLWRSKNSNLYLFENYLAAYLEKEKARLGHNSYRTKANALAYCHWFHDLNIKEIRTAHIEDFTLWLQTDSKLAEGTQVLVLRCLRALLRYAYRRDDIERLPEMVIKAAPQKRIKHLSPQQQRDIIDNIPEQHRPIFLFMCQYGCRVGEACGLCWDDIEKDQKLFWFTRTYSNSHWSKTTKTRRDRANPILGWFDKWLMGRGGFKGIPVFQNPDARTRLRQYNNRVLGTIWRKAMEATGLEPIPLKNSTRHSLGYLLRSLGADMQGIANALGHSCPATTRAYVDDDVDMVAELLLLADQQQTN